MSLLLTSSQQQVDKYRYCAPPTTKVGGNPFSLLPLLIGMTPQVTTQRHDGVLNCDGRTDIGSQRHQTAYKSAGCIKMHRLGNEEDGTWNKMAEMTNG
jgi:hypothetical protein